MFHQVDGVPSRQGTGCGPPKDTHEEQASNQLLPRVEVFSYYRGYALDKITLLLEGTLRASLSCLRMPECHPLQKQMGITG